MKTLLLLVTLIVCSCGSALRAFGPENLDDQMPWNRPGENAYQGGLGMDRR